MLSVVLSVALVFPFHSLDKIALSLLDQKTNTNENIEMISDYTKTKEPTLASTYSILCSNEVNLAFNFASLVRQDTSRILIKFYQHFTNIAVRSLIV